MILILARWWVVSFHKVGPFLLILVRWFLSFHNVASFLLWLLNENGLFIFAAFVIDIIENRLSAGNMTPISIYTHFALLGIQ